MTFIDKPTIQFDSSNMSAFGSLETAEMTPLIQLDFIYGLNTQTSTTSILNTGVVDTAVGRLRLQTGTNAAGLALFNTRRPARYRAGQGITARFTPLFSTGVGSSEQEWGMGNVSGTSINDCYSFKFNGTQFGILHTNTGVPNFIPQSSWNGDKCDGSAGTSFTYNPTLGTPAMIKYPYLGYGNIEFFLQNPNTGRWVLVHMIKYANTTVNTQMSNPSLSFYGRFVNTGNTTNLIGYCGSIGILLSGIRSFVGNPKWAADRNRTAVTTEVPLLMLKNATTYNGVQNRGLIRLNGISGASSIATAVATFRLKIGATVGGTPAFTPISGTTADNGTTITAGNSISSFDVAATTYSAGTGTYIYNLSVGSAGSLVADLTPNDIFIAPGEILTITGACTGSSILGVSINFTEDV
jgi:hypothetical protein